MLVTIRDETATGHPINSMCLDIVDRITLRELIRLRVRAEVARHNAQLDLEQLDRERLDRERLDWERQADAAVTAFGRNRFFVLVADRQVEDLDEELTLAEASNVAFVRLVPLVGG